MSSKVAPVLSTCRCKCACISSSSSSSPSAERHPRAAPTTCVHDRIHTQQQQQQTNQQLQEQHKPHAVGNQQQQHQDDNPLALLQLKVRSLEKYKSNYELLCSQLGELNTQVGLQLEQHEADVASLNATISSLQHSNRELERALQDSQKQLDAQRQVVQQDRKYSERVHAQLSTAAELLKATEKRIESKGQELVAQVEALQVQLDASQSDNDELRHQNHRLQEELVTVQQSATEKLKLSAQKRERLRNKLTRQVQALQSENDALSDELESQRALTRNTKKQLAHEKSENDALSKQLSAVKSDVESLSSMLEQQRAAAKYQEQKQLKSKKQAQQADFAAQSASRQAESLEVELTTAKEDLVRKNASLEALTSDLRALRAQCEQHQRELSQSLSLNEELKVQISGLEQQREAERRKLEDQERTKVRMYRKELHQMRQLLAVNHQKASESSRDVQSLKKELFGVQEMLHAYHSERDSWRQYIADDIMTESDKLKLEACAASKTEESVLKCAIMEQVAAAYPVASAQAPARMKKGRQKK
ncbi:hypothetical protein Gpo141_00005510 [Globisporangium polare]